MCRSASDLASILQRWIYGRLPYRRQLRSLALPAIGPIGSRLLFGRKRIGTVHG